MAGPFPADAVAKTEAQRLALAVRRYMHHPAVLAAGLHHPLSQLVEYLAVTEHRIEALERRLAESEAKLTR